MIYNVNPTDNLQEVVNNAEPNSAIILSSGIYHQKFVITTPNLTLTSSTSSAKDVVIVYDDFAKKLDDCGREYNTFRTYTVAIATDNVTLSNITIANSNTKPSVVGQCVALSVCGSNFVADNCIFTSTQDTLFCAPLPDDLVIRYLDFLPTNLNYIEGETVQKYINCTIVGSVDFIFGCANALFLKCNIVSINCGESCSYVVAPAHSLKQTIGFAFVECDFTSSSCSEKSVYLARPWRDFGLASFIKCSFGSHISDLGFDKWNDTDRDRTARFYIYSSSTLQHLVKWARTLNDIEAKNLLEYFQL